MQKKLNKTRIRMQTCNKKYEEKILLRKKMTSHRIHMQGLEINKSYIKKICYVWVTSNWGQAMAMLTP